MFPSSKLFGLCPDWSTCKAFRCPFSHTPPKPAPAAARPAVPTSSAIPTGSTVPQKRSASGTGQITLSVKRVATAAATQERVKNLVGLDGGSSSRGTNGTSPAGSSGASTSKVKLEDLPNVRSSSVILGRTAMTLSFRCAGRPSYASPAQDPHPHAGCHATEDAQRPVSPVCLACTAFGRLLISHRAGSSKSTPPASFLPRFANNLPRSMLFDKKSTSFLERRRRLTGTRSSRRSPD
jgi:hypothetical protein